MAAILLPHTSTQQHTNTHPRSAAPAGETQLDTTQRALHLVPQPAPAAGAQVYVRRRLAVALAAVIVFAGVWTLASLVLDSFTNDVGADLTPAAKAALTETYVVQPGDTLWSIAATIDTDGDVRDTVDALADANGGATLTAGDRITVPVPG